MLQNRNGADGFTLIELLLVLSISGVMLLLVIPFNQLFFEKQKERQFINVFSSDILFMQEHSRMASGEIRFRYVKQDQKYKIYQDDGHPLIERDLPDDWELKMRTYDIKFSRSGANSDLGNIILKTNQNQYKFIFSLGKGRFRIEKN
ncbi:MAG TPA: competence type IV pilus minor pilin ComGD [Virgibacillus sp.]|nr:competence type IV pilus minor pilin ComGD [Virgibacillus sp.]